MKIIFNALMVLFVAGDGICFKKTARKITHSQCILLVSIHPPRLSGDFRFSNSSSKLHEFLWGCRSAAKFPKIKNIINMIKFLIVIIIFIMVGVVLFVPSVWLCPTKLKTHYYQEVFEIFICFGTFFVRFPIKLKRGEGETPCEFHIFLYLKLLGSNLNQSHLSFTPNNSDYLIGKGSFHFRSEYEITSNTTSL